MCAAWTYNSEALANQLSRVKLSYLTLSQQNCGKYDQCKENNAEIIPYGRMGPRVVEVRRVVTGSVSLETRIYFYFLRKIMYINL